MEDCPNDDTPEIAFDPETADGFVFAYDFIGEERHLITKFKELEQDVGGDLRHSERQLRWIHLDRCSTGSRLWLKQRSGLDDVICEGLLKNETRPRCQVTRNSLLLVLRGVNLNPGANPEDMVSLRLWVEHNRVVSIRGQKVMAVQDMISEIEHGLVIKSAGDLISWMASLMVDRLDPEIARLEDEMERLESMTLGEHVTPVQNSQQQNSQQQHGAVAEEAGENSDLSMKDRQSKLLAIRHEALVLRRYLAPQRDCLAKLSGEQLSWLSEHNRSRFRETTDRISRFVEELESIREQAAVLQETWIAQQQERINRNMYFIAVLSAIFLPLSFLTGLLGVNVGGIPGQDSKIGFFVLCAVLGAIGVAECVFMLRRKWF